jgi:outer membrane protein
MKLRLRYFSFLLLSAWAVCVAFGLPSVVHAQGKIGFVNTERILRESPAALKAADKIQAEFDKRRTEVKSMSDRIAALQKSIEKDGLTMPEAERRVKERDIASISRDLQRAQRELKEDFEIRNSEEIRGLTDRANRIIKRIAEAEKFDLILQEAVFVSPNIDITDRVIKEMS